MMLHVRIRETWVNVGRVRENGVDVMLHLVRDNDVFGGIVSREEY